MSVAINLSGIVTGFRVNEAKKKDKDGNVIDGQTVVYRDVLLSPVDGNGDPLRISIDGKDTVMAVKMLEKAKSMLYKPVTIIGKFRVFDGKIQGVECVDVQLARS